ncbi:MAG: hypothetical protein AB1716_08925 [Planctomycetota bacterium]
MAQIRESRQERDDDVADEVGSTMESLDRRLPGPRPTANLCLYLAVLGTGVGSATQYGLLELQRAVDDRGRALAPIPLPGYEPRDPTAEFISVDLFTPNVSSVNEDAFLALLAFEPPARDARTITLRGKFSLRVPDLVQIQTENLIGRHDEIEHPDLEELGYTLDVDWYSKPGAPAAGGGADEEEDEDDEERALPADWHGDAAHRLKYALAGDPDRVVLVEAIDEHGTLVPPVTRGIGRGGGEGGEMYWARVPGRLRLRLTLVRDWQEWPVRFDLQNIPLP